MTGVDLDGMEYIILAGALDYKNNKFKIFQVPTKDILLYVQQGMIDPMHLYVHLETYRDVRNNAGVPFGKYALN